MLNEGVPSIRKTWALLHHFDERYSGQPQVYPPCGSCGPTPCTHLLKPVCGPTDLIHQMKSHDQWHEPGQTRSVPSFPQLIEDVEFPTRSECTECTFEKHLIFTRAETVDNIEQENRILLLRKPASCKVTTYQVNP